MSIPIEIITQAAYFVYMESDFERRTMRKLEDAARVCYKSENKKTESLQSAEKLVRKCIERGHESVIEHSSLTAYIVTNRAIANEIVRHRLASYSQESTRYVRYSNRMTFVYPMPPSGRTESLNLEAGEALKDTLDRVERKYIAACQDAAQGYADLLREGMAPQTARDLLPLGLKTELYMTANLRQWRHIFKLRLAPNAHPQIRELFYPLLETLHTVLPAVFDDIPLPVDLARNPPKTRCPQTIYAE